MFDFIDFLAYQAIEDAHEEYEREREKEEKSYFSSDFDDDDEMDDDEDVHAIFKAFHSLKYGKNIIHYSSKMRERKREPQMEHKMPAL